jgi:hypothetical protein
MTLRSMTQQGDRLYAQYSAWLKDVFRVGSDDEFLGDIIRPYVYRHIIEQGDKHRFLQCTNCYNDKIMPAIYDLRQILNNYGDICAKIRIAEKKEFEAGNEDFIVQRSRDGAMNYVSHLVGELIRITNDFELVTSRLNVR